MKTQNNDASMDNAHERSECCPSYAQTTPLFLPLSNDQFSRRKNNGTTTIILLKNGSVVVLRVMRSRQSL
ncbi:MAG: hypothetical protein KKG06_05060 [Bacteroidetes bacterium]|nr:hypothetical protein [Bacteroidota bacterium]